MVARLLGVLVSPRGSAGGFFPPIHSDFSLPSLPVFLASVIFSMIATVLSVKAEDKCKVS